MDILLREYGSIVRRKWGWFVVVILGVSLGAGIEILIPLYYQDIANALVLPYSTATHNLLLHSLLMIAALFGLKWLGWRAVELGMILFQSWGLRQLDKRCFDVLVQQRYAFFENNFAGSLVKQANRFIKAFETVIDWLMFEFYGNLLQIAIAFVIFYQQQPTFALYFLLWVILFLGFSGGYLVWKLRYDERVAAMDSKLGGAYADNIGNILILKSFALEGRARASIASLADESYQKRNTAWLLTFALFAVQGLMAFGIELLLLYLMIGKWREGTFVIGEFVLFQTVLLILIRHLWDFGMNFRRFFSVLADAREMAEVFRQTDLERDPPHAQAHRITRGEIRFANVTFGYGATPLFRNLDLLIRAGEKVALVGHSGSGKSTLTKLLFRLVEPQAGQILFDGIPAQGFTLAALRSQLALVPQQPELFHRSLRDNIALGREASDAAIWEAARRAGADGFIRKLPEGLDTLVGERGIKLSGGEKQRIALARAFLQDAPIIVLDEATSALDSLTEQQVQTAIFDLLQGKTAIVIAHRLATILHMDRIIVLEHGEVVEQGTHAELLARRGKYYAMWQHQSGEILP